PGIRGRWERREVVGGLLRAVRALPRLFGGRRPRGAEEVALLAWEVAARSPRVGVGRACLRLPVFRSGSGHGAPRLLLLGLGLGSGRARSLLPRACPEPGDLRPPLRGAGVEGGAL